MATLEQILKTKAATTEDALKVYDELPSVSIDDMLGRWKGFEIKTDHIMDGLLELSGWYGKIFISTEEVYPLVMYSEDKRSLWSLNPKHIPLGVDFPKSKVLQTMMRLAKPFLRTKRSKARLRMVEHRGKITASMIYDDKAIYDHFAKIDDNTVLGCMDLKGVSQPYFWVMQRDNETTFNQQF